MKNFALWIGALLIILGIAMLAFVFLREQKEPEPETVPQNPGTYFPSTGSSTGGTAQRPIMLSTGEQIMANDFINNGVTFEDPVNEGSFYLAGKLDYCLEDGTCPDTRTPEFSILYLEAEQSFIVSLNEEPLRESRGKAEEYLMRALGISQNEMCSLTHTVGTTVSVNEAYGSITDLGFSFCPGATALP